MNIYVWFSIAVALLVVCGIFREKWWAFSFSLVLTLFFFFSFAGSINVLLNDKGTIVGEGISTITQKTNDGVISQHFNGFDGELPLTKTRGINNGILANPDNYIVDMRQVNPSKKLFKVRFVDSVYELKKHIED